MTRTYVHTFLLFSFCAAHAAPLGQGDILAPSKLGELVVSHDSNGFSIQKNGISSAVSHYDLSPELRGISEEHLASFLENGYLSVSCLSDGSYKLASHTRGIGGGPGLGIAAYWTAKVLMYGGIVAGVVSGIVKPEFGGHSIAAERNAMIAGQRAMNGAMAGRIIAQEAAMVGVNGAAIGVVGAHIAATESGRQLTQAGVACVAGGGTAAAVGLTGTIETIATTVGVIFGMAPTP